MKKGNRSFKESKVQVVLFSLLLTFCLTIPSYSRGDNSVFKTESIELPVTGNNNVAIASERYIFVAPAEPSSAITENTPLEQYNNNMLCLYDSKKLNNEPSRYSLGNCYFPTLVLYDAETGMVFVKGTELVEIPSGEYKPYAVIKYLQFNLAEDNAKPISNGIALTIRIPGIDDEKGVSVAPDYVVHNKKDVIMFTNGASIFTFNRVEGFSYRVNLITPEDHDPVDNTITNLSFDSASNVVTVLISKKVKTGDNQWARNSELYFYELAGNGTLNLLKRLAPEALPVGVSVPDGSNIAINTEGENVDASFVGTDGVLYQISLTEERNLSGSVEALASFEALRQSSVNEHLSAVFTYYNKATRVFELVKNGYTANIHRPINVGRGRIGRIHRPINLRFNVEGPAVVLAQFSKKNRLINQKVFSAEIDKQGGVFMFSDHAENRYVACYDGNVFALNLAQGVNDATLKLLGQLGSRLSSVTEVPGREVLVAVNASELGDEDAMLTAPGAIMVAKRREESNFLSLVNWTEDGWSFDPVLGLGLGSIRRPCNFRFY